MPKLNRVTPRIEIFVSRSKQKSPAAQTAGLFQVYELVAFVHPNFAPTTLPGL